MYIQHGKRRHKATHRQVRETMSLSAELEATLNYAGISARQFGVILDINLATPSRWNLGTKDIPDGIIDKAERLATLTTKVINALTKYIDNTDSPVIATYRQTDDMPRCDARRMGSVWWNHVVTQARGHSQRGAANVPVVRYSAEEHPTGATVTPELLNGTGIPALIADMRKKPEVGRPA